VTQFRYAISNGVFEGWPFGEAVKAARKAGYTGLEIAPCILSEDPASLPPGKRREYRSIMESEGVEFVGLHWLLLAPEWLHVTTADTARRERSWDYVRRLIDLCADLGPGGVVVFGSAKQRRSTAGVTIAEAERHLAGGLAKLAPHAAQQGITLLLEPVSPDQTDVVTSLDRAAAIVREIGHPAVKTMFDVHNAVAEREAHGVLVDRHFELIRHVHLNEPDGRHPGAGGYDFKPVLEVLRRRGYTGWISMEVFDLTPGAEKVAHDSLRYIRAEATAATS
jgi:sugar phosphate isomerase/epimerase